MRFFPEFRRWTYEASPLESVGTAFAVLIVMGLVVWLLVPASGDSSPEFDESVSANPTSVTVGSGSIADAGISDNGANTNGATGAGTSTGPGAGARSTASAISVGTGTPTSSGCEAAPASGPGVTGTQLKLVIMLIDIAGPAANGAFGVSPPADQQAAYDAVIDSINDGGGIACRTVVAQYLHVNPADQTDQHAKCLTAVEAQPFAVIDPGAYSFTTPICFAQHGVPYFGGFFLTTKQIHEGYPFLFNLANYDHLYRDTVLGFRDRGAFDPAKGFKKLGLVYRDCHQELIAQEFDALRQAGLKDDQIVDYNLGCPSAFADPSALQQAILKFQSANVTHLTAVYAYGDLANFTNLAERQRFRPQYLLADDGIVAISYGNLRPNPENIANALIITPSRYAEERTPGMRPSAGTAACDSLRKARGLRPTYEVDPQQGNACNELWMIKAAAEHAPALRNDALAAGLRQAKSIDFSYPSGPNNFSGPKVTTGGQFWRMAQFVSACSCWRVIDPTFHPSYP
jgi:hypothetical protein